MSFHDNNISSLLYCSNIIHSINSLEAHRVNFVSDVVKSIINSNESNIGDLFYMLFNPLVSKQDKILLGSILCFLKETGYLDSKNIHVRYLQLSSITSIANIIVDSYQCNKSSKIAYIIDKAWSFINSNKNICSICQDQRLNIHKSKFNANNLLDIYKTIQSQQQDNCVVADFVYNILAKDSDLIECLADSFSNVERSIRSVKDYGMYYFL